MQKIAVGEVLPFGEELKLSPAVDSVGYHLSDTGADMLVISYNGLTAKEIEAFDKGQIEFKFCVLNEVVFVLNHFKGLNIMDTPVSRKSIDPTNLINQNFDLTLDESTGKAVHIIVVDTKNGQPIVTVQRLISLSNSFSTDFTRAVREQPVLSDEAFTTKVAMVQSKYNSKQLASFATKRYIVPAK